MSKKYMRDMVPLVVICLVSALLLASFNLLTKDPIQQNSQRAAEETRTRMLPIASSFEPMEVTEGSNMDSVYQGLDASGEPVGYVIQTTVNGYGGEVVVTLGMDMDGVITGVDVGGENFSETPGLGALAKEPAFTQQYIGKKVPLTLVKGNEPKGENTIDAISGATRTSSAVNGGINLAGKYISDLSGGGSPNTASAQGFGGPVAVTLELDASGAISSITIGDDYFNETEGYGKKALEDSFSSQFIGMKPPLTLSDIDAISGATVTSTAVVNAINTVYAQLTGEASTAAPAEEEAPAAQLYEDGTWRAAFKGFGGPVMVALTLDDNLTIQSIQIGDDQFAETEGYGAQALEPAFQEQFIGKTLPLKDGDVDGISGATMTTTAVLDGIDAIYQAATDDTPDEPQPLPTPAAESETQTDDAATVSTSVAATTDGNGSWTASVQGFAGPVAVTLTLDDSLTIQSIEIGDDQFAETDGLGAKAKEAAFTDQFVGKTLPLADGDIDAIAGATITTNAVLDAVNAIYEAAGNGAAEVTDAPAASDAPEATDAPEASAAAIWEVTHEGDEWTTAAQGFAGPVAVTLTLDDSLTIQSIEIGDDQFAETDGLGAKAKDAEFTDQFVGKTLPLKDGDIDAISGATITTNAVLDAVNAIYEAADTGAPEATEAPAAADVPEATEAPETTEAPEATEAPVATDAPVAEGEVVNEGTVWSASAQGFAGPVAVQVTLDGLTIKSIKIGDDQFAETDGLGAKALDPMFQLQFVDKTLPLADGDVEAISGATITTNAVLEALNAIYEAASAETGVIGGADGPTAIYVAEPEATDEPEDSIEVTNEGTVWSASAQGFAGPVAVQVTLDGLTIKSIKIGDDQFAETDGLGAKALDPMFQLQFVDKTLPLADGDVEAISGATITTNAVLEALNAIYETASADTAVIGGADGPTAIYVAEPEETAEPEDADAPAESAEVTNEGTVWATSAQGFAGPVAVQVTLDGLTIKSIKIGDDQFAETDGLGANALDPMFQLQFVDKTLPLAEGDVEAISGATITTDAVLSALNAIYEAAK